MNVLFLTLLDFYSIEESGIYTDLMREFVKNGHRVSIISPTEKRERQAERVISYSNYSVVKLKIGNMQKTNLIEKGFSTITLDSKFLKGIQKYYAGIKFDLILYSTPPITLKNAISFVKKRDDASTYLLLKDIFPQNAVDLGMMSTRGIKGVLYTYFRKKEQSVYRLSDHIGCMSQGNVDYVLSNNPNIPDHIVEVCPNSIKPLFLEKDDVQTIKEIKMKYHIPDNKVVCIYGGNLGKPQGIDFLLECLTANKDNEEVYFLIVGSGTEFHKLKQFIAIEKPRNVQLFHTLPKKEYETVVNISDVGLIFLDHRFTIPNFPSRILSYMQASLPVLAATDPHTDLGRVIEHGEFGLWCESNDLKAFNDRLKQLGSKAVREQMGNNAREYLEAHYTARHSYEIIMKHFRQETGKIVICEPER